MTDFVDQLGIQRTDPTQTLQSGAVATGNGTAMQVRAMEGVLLHVIGITTATLIIQGADANGNTATLTVKDVNTGVSASSITTNGFYVVAFEGLTTINAIIQSYTSGTITVTGAPANVSLVGGSSGNNASTVAEGANVVEGSTTDVAVVGDTAGTISAKLRGFSKMWNDVWDSANHFFKVSLGTLLAGEDLVKNLINVLQSATNSGPISSSTLVASGVVNFAGFICTASSSGVIRVWDNTTNSGTKILDSITVVAGTVYTIPGVTTPTGTGLYFELVSGTCTVTMFYK